MSAVLPARAEDTDQSDASARALAVIRPVTPRRRGTWQRPGWLHRLLEAAEPTLGELEPAYRRHFLASDIEQAVLGLRYLLIPTIFFALADFLLVGLSGTFAMLLFMRLYMVAAILVTIRYVRRIQRPADLDRALLIWSVVGITTVYVMNALRPQGQNLQFGIQALALLAIYLVIPNTLVARLTMATIVMVMAAVMHLGGLRQPDPSTLLQVWATIILTNAMGLAISSRFYTLRREQFVSRFELERARDELHALAMTDGLTGLLSRRRLLELAERDLARAHRYRRPLSVLAIDLDHFKQVNDRFGHAAGDLVLVAVAQALREQTRQHDLVGRIGGEELAVVLPETGLEAAERLAQRIRVHIGMLRPIADGNTIGVTVSLGVAEAGPEDSTIQELLKRADRALYRAKERGRDCVVAA